MSSGTLSRPSLIERNPSRRPAPRRPSLVCVGAMGVVRLLSAAEAARLRSVRRRRRFFPAV